MEDSCFVFFRQGVCDLTTAAKSLAEYGLSVTRRGDVLTVGRPGSPQFRISISADPHVSVEAAEIGEGTPHAAAMKDCEARFEIVIDYLDEALDEINTLMEIQGALQDISQGYLFLSWNGNLSKPWTE